MEIATSIAKAFGLYLVASGIFLLFRGRSFPLVLKDLFQHRALLWLAGLFLIVIGGTMAFQGSRSLVVVVLGWLTLVKGFIYIIYPDVFLRFTKRPYRSFTTIWGVLYVAFGIWLVSL